MENHHFQWTNPLFLWSFSMAMLNYQRDQRVFYVDDDPWLYDQDGIAGKPTV